MMKAIIFDVDGVLLDSFEANLKFYQDLMEKLGYLQPTREQFRHLFHFSMYEVIRRLTQLTEEKDLKNIWELGRSRSVPYNLDLLAVPENAGEVLEELSQHFKLAIVTSRVQESVFESPKLADLKPYFSVVITYQDTENHKPHPEPLLLAATKLSIKPEDCIYVGDVENDLVAARAANMKVVIYSPNPNEQADATTKSFTDLPRIVSNL